MAKGGEIQSKFKGKPETKALAKAPAKPSGKVKRDNFAKKEFDLTKLKCKPKGFLKDRLYKKIDVGYSKLIYQTTVVDGLKLTPLATLLKEKKVVVVTDKGEKFGILPLTSSTPHLRPYALETLRGIAKEFYEKSGGYKLLVSSLFRSPDQQIKEAKKNPAAIKANQGVSTHLFGNTFDFSVTRFIAPNGKEVNKPSLLKTLDEILIKYQKCGRAMGFFENAARHVIAAKP
jgi:hypothetical protein